jgi:ABC-type multidrug transport system fused ATPase/permease subunit
MSDDNVRRSSKTLKKKFTPITLSWNISAYSKSKKSFVEDKKNVIKEKINRVRKSKDDDIEMNYGGGSSKPEKKTILKDGLSVLILIFFKSFSYSNLHLNLIVSGIIRPGELCAIMGASGAGKTTLLNILNFRKKANIQSEGEVKINNQNTDWNTITRYSGYVQQEDLFLRFIYYIDIY